MNCWSNTILSVDTESIVIPSGVCNDVVIHEIDLSNYRKMRSLHIGSSSYASVRVEVGWFLELGNGCHWCQFLPLQGWGILSPELSSGPRSDGW